MARAVKGMFNKFLGGVKNQPTSITNHESLAWPTTVNQWSSQIEELVDEGVTRPRGKLVLYSPLQANQSVIDSHRPIQTLSRSVERLDKTYASFRERKLISLRRCFSQESWAPKPPSIASLHAILPQNALNKIQNGELALTLSSLLGCTNPVSPEASVAGVDVSVKFPCYYCEVEVESYLSPMELSAGEVVGKVRINSELTRKEGLYDWEIESTPQDTLLLPEIPIYSSPLSTPVSTPMIEVYHDNNGRISSAFQLFLTEPTRTDYPGTDQHAITTPMALASIEEEQGGVICIEHSSEENDGRVVTGSGVDASTVIAVMWGHTTPYHHNHEIEEEEEEDEEDSQTEYSEEPTLYSDDEEGLLFVMSGTSLDEFLKCEQECDGEMISDQDEEEREGAWGCGEQGDRWAELPTPELLDNILSYINTEVETIKDILSRED
eukprot:sb/3464823/